MKILVAGATGVVGRSLLPRLVREGHEVAGLVRSADKMPMLEQMGATALMANVFDREAIRSALLRFRPEVVIHQLTSLGSRNFSDNARIRMEGTRHLVDAAKEAGVTRFLAQSISWAYEPGVGLASEEMPLHLAAEEPRRSTIEGICALESAAAEIPDSVILRYGMFYGPGTWYAPGGYMADQVRQGLLPATEGKTSFLHVEDAAEAAVSALYWPAGPVNIVDDEPARGAEWLPVYAQAIGAPEPEQIPGGHGWERGASNGKARREYGWIPRYPTWREGFADLRDQRD